MDKTLKTKWIKALRSGKYKQGYNKLKDKEGNYCCLGVLANIQGCQWKLDDREFPAPYIGKKRVSALDSATGFLSPSFAHLTRSRQSTLVNLNDGGKNFKEIADYIEKLL